MVAVSVGGSICQGSNPVPVGVSVGYFNTIAELRAETETFTDSPSVLVSGNQTATDGQGGIYTYDPSSTAADNGYSVIQQANSTGAGRWVLQQPLAMENGFVTDTGAANLIDVPQITRAASPPAGSLIGVVIAETNTGPTSLAIGTTTINVYQNGAALSGGEVVAGMPAIFQMGSDIAYLIWSAQGAVNITAGTASTHATNLGQVQTLIAALQSTLQTEIDNIPASAAPNGSASNVFEAAAGTASNDVVILGQFEKKTAVQFTQSGSISGTSGNTYTVVSGSITFPSFSKTGAFTVRALLRCGWTSPAAGVQNLKNSLYDGAGLINGTNWFINAGAAADTGEIGDHLIDATNYAPGDTVTFTHKITIGGGTGTWTLSGGLMLLEIEEA